MAETFSSWDSIGYEIFTKKTMVGREDRTNQHLLPMMDRGDRVFQQLLRMTDNENRSLQESRNQEAFPIHDWWRGARSMNIAGRTLGVGYKRFRLHTCISYEDARVGAVGSSFGRTLLRTCPRCTGFFFVSIFKL